MATPRADPQDDLGKEIRRLEATIGQLTVRRSALENELGRRTSPIRAEVTKLQNKVRERQERANRLESQIKDIETSMGQALLELERQKKDAQGKLDQLRKLQTEREQKATIASSLAVLRGDRAKAAQIVEFLSAKDRNDILQSIDTLYQIKQKLAEAIRQLQARADDPDYQGQGLQFTVQQLQGLLSVRNRVEDVRTEAEHHVEGLYKLTADRLRSAIQQCDAQLLSYCNDLKQTRQRIQQVTQGKPPEVVDRQEVFIASLEKRVGELEKCIQDYPPLADLIGYMSQWRNNVTGV